MDWELSKIYQIDGEPIPVPDSVQVSIRDVESANSGEAQDGYTNISIIAYGKRTVTLHCDMLPSKVLSAMLVRMHQPYYNLTYRDPELGITTIKCSAATKTVGQYLAQCDMWEEVEIKCEGVEGIT